MVDRKGTSTKVIIFGESYNIRSQADPEYTKMVADLVNQTMFEIKRKVGLQDVHKVAILAAMSITDELLQAREIIDNRSGELENKCSSLIDLIETYLEGDKEETVLSR